MKVQSGAGDGGPSAPHGDVIIVAVQPAVRGGTYHEDDVERADSEAGRRLPCPPRELQHIPGQHQESKYARRS